MRVYVCATHSITKHFVCECVSSCVLVYLRACASECICGSGCADVCVKTRATKTACLSKSWWMRGGARAGIQFESRC